MVGGDGTVYAEAYGYLNASRVVAIDPLTGAMRWATYAGSYLQAGPAVAPDGSVYVHGATLFALASDGGIRWSQATTSTVLPKSVPVIDTNGTVYVGANDSLVAFAPDGSKRWVYTAPSSTGTASIDVAPAIGADGSILQPVTGTAQATLAALDPASGTVRSLGYGENAHVDLTPIVDGGGWVYYVAGDNKLYGVDGNGQNPWSLQLPTMINGAPALGTGSVLYLSGNDGKLYAIGP
jgi:outer membrane protein assembly factor BamB